MAVSRTGGPAAGRKFPTGANYVETLQNPTLCFEDPDLKHGTVQQSPVLGPKAISGNFASVFSITAPGGQRYALKCFTRDSSTLEARYQAISGQLAGLEPAKLSQPWPVGIEYLPRGVLVAGEWYPALKMAWVEGTNLITWIERNIRDTTAVHKMAERFAALVADLERLGVAHGDLQHGNLLVAADGTFRLVDYDGMYVPALKGQGATENGHRNYQSPTRTSADFGPAMDRFSAWVIYLSLVAIATDPAIWDQLHEAHGEFLILKEDDFKEPRSSPAWSLLLTHADPDLRALAAQTHGHLTAAAPAVPPLTTSKAAPTPRPAPAVNQQGGTPSWLAGHIPQPRNAPAASGASTGTGTAAGAGFARRRPGDILAGIFALTGSAAPATLTAIGTLPTGSMAAAQLGALLLSGGALHATRRSRPEARASKARILVLRQQVDALADSVAAAQKIDQEIESLNAAGASRDTEISRQIKSLQTQLRDEQSRITVRLNKETGELRTKLSGLAAKEQQRLDAALASAVRTHIQDTLRRTSVQDVKKLSNMGSGTVTNLIAAGIRTAADFTGVRYVQGSRHGNRDAYLVRPNGYKVKVPGVGEVRAAALESWRASLEQRARKSAPTSVSAQERAAIRQQFAAQKKRYETDITQAESAARHERDQLQQRITTRLQQINKEKQQHQATTQQQRAVLLQRQSQLADATTTHGRLVTQLATARMEHRRAYGLRRYIRFVTTGR
ncbi:hypothetical protein [Streptomyces rubradiris]|uniref:Protein kinase domain-containing protein n=1 Tax=Streptomyces rubradiris TaxID=285531 RepID=A0ABQ3RKH0_STRRR|nr:hypothetical protein [Streptomyces rubradiris]GHH24130.1 hypothetical protein GCM10018792_61440 [Streptomyces rubradiris]GHI56237.1 hypothetical protein Srubr_60830 [Streptomyces rubradiris]